MVPRKNSRLRLGNAELLARSPCIIVVSVISWDRRFSHSPGAKECGILLSLHAWTYLSFNFHMLAQGGEIKSD